MVLQSIKFNSEDASLEIIDQLLLPEKTQYLKIKGVEDGWSVINKMQVRDLFVCSCKHIVALRLLSSSNIVVDNEVDLFLGSRCACYRNRRQSLACGRDLEGRVSG